MRTHLKIFEGHSNYESFEINTHAVPAVSYCKTQKELHYEKKEKILTFIALQKNSTIKLNRMGTAATLNNASLQYSLDGGETWNDYTYEIQGKAGYSGQTITLENIGDSVKFKGTNGAFCYSGNYHKFSMTGKIKSKGQITSIFNEIGGDVDMPISGCSYLFDGCTALTSAPQLPSSNIGGWCYCYMFRGCTSLVLPPSLPSKYAPAACYYYMFNNCTSLKESPELPAVSIGGGSCYRNMFQGCTSLTAAPKLPASRLVAYCYYNMFQGCTSLTAAPELPAETLASYCYYGMFENCTSLKLAPELTAETLASYCYKAMFKGCTLLTKAPELPSTTLAVNCYENMFLNCTSLLEAPELPATILKKQCYDWMFYGCKSLSIAHDFSATTLAEKCCYGMFCGCVSLRKTPKLQATVMAPTAYIGMFCGCTSLTTICELPASALSTSCYENMFAKCYSLSAAPELPATSLAASCYKGMFANCTALTEAPELSANVLAASAYCGMFSGCTSLETPPLLQSMNLANYCYANMFIGCTSLTALPSLPATSLTPYCYYAMFSYCSFSSCQTLPATTLAESCYRKMFSDNINLISVHSLIATNLAKYCYRSMFYGCSNLSEVQNSLPATALSQGCYYSMFYGCSSLIKAPILPSTSLTNECYQTMFCGCHNINYINAMFTTTPSTAYTNNWVSGVSNSGTFVKNSYANWNVRGNNGIPNNWEIQLSGDSIDIVINYKSSLNRYHIIIDDFKGFDEDTPQEISDCDYLDYVYWDSNCYENNVYTCIGTVKIAGTTYYIWETQDEMYVLTLDCEFDYHDTIKYDCTNRNRVVVSVLNNDLETIYGFDKPMYENGFLLFDYWDDVQPLVINYNHLLNKYHIIVDDLREDFGDESYGMTTYEYLDYYFNTESIYRDNIYTCIGYVIYSNETLYIWESDCGCYVLTETYELSFDDTIKADYNNRNCVIVGWLTDDFEFGYGVGGNRALLQKSFYFFDYWVDE